MSERQQITTLAQLQALYGEPVPAAITKELESLSSGYRAFIEKAPFVVIATSGPEGLDCSPRGDPPGFVRVVDAKTLMLPDRRGNNRVDALRNLIDDPRISLLFLIPGVGETLRVNGRAEIVVDEELNNSFAIQGKQPRCVLVIHVEKVYFQCPKALVRSKLWSAEAQIDRKDLPSPGELLEEICASDFNAIEFDAVYPDRVKQTMY